MNATESCQCHLIVMHGEDGGNGRYARYAALHQPTVAAFCRCSSVVQAQQRWGWRKEEASVCSVRSYISTAIVDIALHPPRPCNKKKNYQKTSYWNPFRRPIFLMSLLSSCLIPALVPACCACPISVPTLLVAGSVLPCPRKYRVLVERCAIGKSLKHQRSHSPFLFQSALRVHPSYGVHSSERAKCWGSLQPVRARKNTAIMSSMPVVHSRHRRPAQRPNSTYPPCYPSTSSQTASRNVLIPEEGAPRPRDACPPLAVPSTRLESPALTRSGGAPLQLDQMLYTQQERCVSRKLGSNVQKLLNNILCIYCVIILVLFGCTLKDFMDQMLVTQIVGHFFGSGVSINIYYLKSFRLYAHQLISMNSPRVLFILCQYEVIQDTCWLPSLNAIHEYSSRDREVSFWKPHESPGEEPLPLNQILHTQQEICMSHKLGSNVQNILNNILCIYGVNISVLFGCTLKHFMDQMLVI